MESLCVELLSCRSVRLGTYRVLPQNKKKYVTVYLTPDSIKFCAPYIRGYFPLHEIVIKCEDMNRMIWCLKKIAVLFIQPKDAFAEEVGNSLGIDGTCLCTFDPYDRDLRSLFITFNISFLTQEQINFIRDYYLPIETCREVDEQVCKKLMLMPAPVLTSNFLRICSPDADPSIVLEEDTDVGVSESPLAAKEITVVSYRSKSRSGVVPLTNIDIMCLNNGNWLNNNMMNFYLEYTYSEGLTES
ncbi:sentrin-specific protease 6 [Trichonephila clavata]|uniref:Sentrin-specific protease 6 n=1 Tax=Trichonephila clavata TaxID=2740835 RepID=A0A8X6F1V0_TRICU|nr:sentrin-specific protease 6 [Trichonephila clavata]